MQKKDFLYTLKDLKKYLKAKNLNLKKIAFPPSTNCKQNFHLLFSKYYAQIIDWYNPQDPLRKMVMPSGEEQIIKKYEVSDPLGDKIHASIPGIIQQYEDRCLLNLTNNCAVHCRFCFRKNLLSGNNRINISDCLSYIKEHKEIWEVIFSGGDPFTLTDRLLAEILNSIRQIKHVKMIRFHTRTPVVYPKRINSGLLKILSKSLPNSVVFHINHPREITKQFKNITAKLKKRTSFLLSQTVLMKGVNDDPVILGELFKGLAEIGIKPYYLHHPDPAKGTHHFRVSIEEGQRIMKNLQENMSGLCLPEYVVYLPKGGGKIAVLSLKKINNNHYTSTNSKGEKITYADCFNL